MSGSQKLKTRLAAAAEQLAQLRAENEALREYAEAERERANAAEAQLKWQGRS